jgi:hypothetical protein
VSTRISVTYPATGGSMPENIEILWEDETPDPDLVHSLAGMLVRAPSARNEVTIVDRMGQVERLLSAHRQEFERANLERQE